MKIYLFAKPYAPFYFSISIQIILIIPFTLWQGIYLKLPQVNDLTFAEHDRFNPENIRIPTEGKSNLGNALN